MSKTETIYTSFGALCPGMETEMAVCTCKNEPDYVFTITDRDDFVYDECPNCGKMISGSARPHEDW